MEITVGNLVAGGDAIARLPSGKVVFIEGALPGEVVDFELTVAKKDFSRGSVVRVIEPSTDRVEPPCPHVQRGCGGCQWQHMSAGGQFDAKARIAAESLLRVGRITLADRVVEGSRVVRAVESVGYRTTVRVAFDREGRPGFRRKSTNDVVGVDDCLVAHPLINRVLPQLSARPGSDVEITLRCSTTTEVVGGMVHGDIDDVRGLEVLDVVGSDARLIETIHGTDLVVSMGAFFQSGPAAAELLVDTVRRLAGPEALSGALGQVVDAYGGGGLFAATLVPTHVPVTLIEENPFAIDDARHNLSGRSVSIVESAVEDWKARPAGLVIADPARTGMGRAAVEILAATNATVFVLVSCDAAAGARDARLLVEAGYELEDYAVLDLFPHTNHLEMVMRFKRAVAADDSRPLRRLDAADVPPAA